MGNNSEANNEVVESRSETAFQLRTDLSGYMPTRKSQEVGVTVLVKVCGEESNQDFLIDLATHITDTLDSVLLGSHGLAKAVHQSGYQTLDGSELRCSLGES